MRIVGADAGRDNLAIDLGFENMGIAFFIRRNGKGRFRQRQHSGGGATGGDCQAVNFRQQLLFPRRREYRSEGGQRGRHFRRFLFRLVLVFCHRCTSEK